MYTETRTECWYESSPNAGYSAGGGSATYFSNDDHLAASSSSGDFLIKITNSDTMPSGQKAQLKEALNDFLNYCLQQAVYKQLVASGMKFNFAIDPNASSPANFNPFNNTINFQSANGIEEQYLREELFHGYQDSFYDGGITQYTNAGNPNIEFEAKLFKDLTNYVEGRAGQNYGVPMGNPRHDDYIAWISNITSGFTKYPTVINLDKYFEFLEAFKQSYPNHNKPTNSSLNPDALINAIKGSNCPK